MIRHIVFFRVKNRSAVDTKRLVEGLKGLEGSTDGLMLEAVVAHDVARTKSSYDVVLNSLFRDMDELEKYRVHPEHVKVLKIIDDVCTSVVKIDYEE